MNEITITLTEEQMDTIHFALSLLKEYDERRIRETAKELEEETDGLWIDLLKTRESGYWGQISKVMNLQKMILSRKARATA